MQALNAQAEYQAYADVIRSTGVTPPTETEYIEFSVRMGLWVEDDGDYYTAEEWATQYDEGDMYTGPTYPEYDD